MTYLSLIRPTSLPLAAASLLLGWFLASDPPEVLTPKGFGVEKEVLVPVPPGEAFDAFTGDISGWWDHSFSDRPDRLVLEPKPGGGFYEWFDQDGNGARHAVVTFAKRGEELHFRGPLGFASLGVAFEMTHTVKFSAVEGGTRVQVRVRGMGEVADGWPEAVNQVWHHFLVERFEPYVRATLGK